MNTTKLQQLTLNRVAIKTQLEATHLLLDAAHMQSAGSERVMALHTQAHDLLDQYHIASASIVAELRKSMGT